MNYFRNRWEERDAFIIITQSHTEGQTSVEFSLETNFPKGRRVKSEMALIKLLCLVCVSLLLLLEGVRPKVVLYSRPGDDVTLRCDGLRGRGPTCSDVNWTFYKGASTNATYEVRSGVVQDSGSSRMTLNSDCSLSLQNITEGDSGQFDCYLNGKGLDTCVHLNILTVSAAPVDPNEDEGGSITLQCRLWTYEGRCESMEFRWFNQKQKGLSAQTTNCQSNLTVERASQCNDTFTCQFVEGGEVKVSAEYRLEGNKESDQTPDPDDKNQTRGNCEESKGWSWFLVLKTVGWSALISATVVVSIYTRVKGKPKRSNGDFETVSSFYVRPGDMAPSADYENQPLKSGTL